jgi:hypothetical protein
LGDAAHDYSSNEPQRQTARDVLIALDTRGSLLLSYESGWQHENALHELRIALLAVDADLNMNT